MAPRRCCLVRLLQNLVYAADLSCPEALLRPSYCFFFDPWSWRLLVACSRSKKRHQLCLNGVSLGKRLGDDILTT